MFRFNHGILLACALVGAAAPAWAQHADSASVRDGVYSSEQATRGKTVFDEACSACHATDYFVDAFLTPWVGAPLGTLFEVIASSMPLDNPGSLRPAEYAAVLAYILQLNGLPAGTDSLPSDEDHMVHITIEEHR